MNREELLSKFADSIKIGTHGFVRLIDVMGDDAAIVQAARVSYGAGTKTPSEDEALIRYLLRHRHTSPLEQAELKLHIKAPMHVFRQLIRHRTANINEVSTRYSVVEDEFEFPTEFRAQSTNNKQGSSGELVTPQEVLNWRKGMEGAAPDWCQYLLGLPNEEDFMLGYKELDEVLTASYEEVINHSYDVYNSFIGLGVAREQARNVLPLATYSEMYWKCDLHNLLHFLTLRLDSHAQLEIREFAEAIASIVKVWCPFAWRAFEDYRLYGVSLSRQEFEILSHIVNHLGEENFKNLCHNSTLSKREKTEFIKKFFPS